MTKEDEAKVLQLIKNNDERNLALLIEKIANAKEIVWNQITGYGCLMGIFESSGQPQDDWRNVFIKIRKHILLTIDDIDIILPDRCGVFELMGAYTALHWLFICFHWIGEEKFLWEQR